LSSDLLTYQNYFSSSGQWLNYVQIVMASDKYGQEGNQLKHHDIQA
jgi:hypothetical protein